MFRTNVFTFLSLLFCCTVAAQKATIALGNSFKHVSFSGKRVHVGLLAHDHYAIVTNGIPLDGLYFNLKNGFLDIHIKKKQLSEKETLVILYPKNEPMPKIVSLPEWAALDPKE